MSIHYLDKSKNFCRVKTERFNENKTQYIVRCGDIECDLPLNGTDLIITTYNDEGNNRHYHIDCYTESLNYVCNEYPNSTKQLQNYDKLMIQDQRAIQQTLFPLIKSNKFQLFTLSDTKFCLDPYVELHSSRQFQNILRERDIEVYTEYNTKWVWSWPQAFQKLKEFYSKREVTDKLQILVLGYIKDILKNENDATWVCQTCGEENTTNVEECVECEMGIRSDKQDEHDTWVCQTCGEENTTNVEECFECEIGTRRESQMRTRVNSIIDIHQIPLVLIGLIANFSTIYFK